MKTILLITSLFATVTASAFNVTVSVPQNATSMKVTAQQVQVDLCNSHALQVSDQNS